MSSVRENRVRLAELFGSGCDGSARKAAHAEVGMLEALEALEVRLKRL